MSAPIVVSTVGVTLVGGAPATRRALGAALRLAPCLVAADGGASSLLTEGEAGGGAGTAAGLSVLGKAGARIARGRKMTPEARRLVDAEVELTPAQLNPRGIYAQAENIATSLPVAGPVIRNARTRAQQEARAAAIREVVPQASGSTWDDTLESAVNQLDKEYAGLDRYRIKTVPGLKPGQPDPRIIMGLQNQLNDPAVLASPDARKTVASYATSQLQRIRGTPTVADYQAIRSDFRTQGRRLSKALTDDDRAKGELFNRAADVVSVQMNRSLPLAARKNLRRTDAKYFELRPYVGAEARGAGTVDGPTFGAMEASIKGTMTPNQVARAGGRQRREFVDSARQVFDERRDPLTGARMLGAPFALALAPVATLGAGTQIGRNLSAGTTGVQKGLRKVTDNDQMLAIINALRGGTAGALEAQGNY
jgi:hypothetical protein